MTMDSGTVIDSVLAEALSAQYPSMLSLDLRSNSISAIRDLQPLSRLRELRLDNNQLTELDGLQGLKFLTALSAQDNAIARLCESVTSLSRLQLLNLAGNQLEAGPWISLLAKLPGLIDLDVRGNPVCQLEGSQQLLAAALPSLERLNGVELPPPAPAATLVASGSGTWQAGLQHPAAPRREQPGSHAADLGAYNGSRAGHAEPAHTSFAPAPAPDAPPWHEHTTLPYRARSAPTRGQPPMASVLSQSAATVAMSGRNAPSGPWVPAHVPDAEVLLLTQQRLEAAEQAQEALLQHSGALATERDALQRRAMAAEEALQGAEDGNARLQQQLSQHSAQAAARVAALADQLTALTAERDAAVRQADSLSTSLADARAAAAEAAQAVGVYQQRADLLQGENRRLQHELSATQDLLLQAQAAVNGAAAVASAAAGRGDPAGQGSPGEGRGRGAGQQYQQPQGGAAPAGAPVEAAALQQRVAALQHIIRVQERELARLGGLQGVRSAGGPAGVTSDQDAAGVESLLQPWRKQVQSLHEQLSRAAAEGAEQRAVWSQQLGEMREQFSQARMLMEVLEQRSKEQRSENTQLHARISQLSLELQESRGRTAGLEQQVAARDAAAQAVRRQLVAFMSQHEQQVAALEARTAELDAHAARLSYACTRLGFVLRLAAVRRQGAAVGACGALAAGGWTPLKLNGRGSQPQHVTLQGVLAASPAAAVAAASGAVLASQDELGPQRPLGSGGAKPGGSGPDDSPLVAVLRQELSRMSREREVLLQQLAQVSASAEERIRQAQAAMTEREARHREAFVAARLEAAQRAAEGEAERRIHAAEAASAALVTHVRQQMQAAVLAAEEACRRAEATAGVRVSRALVRLQDVVKQVGLLRSAQQRAARDLRAVTLERDRLRDQLEQAQATAADLNLQLAKRGSAAHAQVAELQAAHDEALAAERRRTGEAERLAAKASAECGQLERQLARLREVKVQQEDARLRRLQSQLHEQETQLRTSRRERATLLAVLRKHNLHALDAHHVDHPRPDTAPDDTRAAPEAAPLPPVTTAPYDAPSTNTVTGMAGQGQGIAIADFDTAVRRGMMEGMGLPLPLSRHIGPAAETGGGGFISSILRGAVLPARPLGTGPDTATAAGDAGDRQALCGTRDELRSPDRDDQPVPASHPTMQYAAAAAADTEAAWRLAELEALTAELLSM